MPPLHGGGRRFKPYRNHQLTMQLELFTTPMDQSVTTKDLIAMHHIRVVHFFDKWYPKGGCTVAYRPEIYDYTGYPKGKFARVAVAWCNPKDTYDRKAGEAVAVELLMEGNYNLMPIYVEGHPVRALRAMFQDSLIYHKYLY